MERSIVVYYAADRTTLLSDSYTPSCMNEDGTWISDEMTKKAIAMALHINRVGGAVYYFRCLPDGTNLYVFGKGLRPGQPENPEWLSTATKLAEDYLKPQSAN